MAETNLDRLSIICKELEALERAKRQDDWTVYQDAVAKLELGAIEKIEFLVGKIDEMKIDYAILMDELIERTRERDRLRQALEAAEVQKAMGL